MKRLFSLSLLLLFGVSAFSEYIDDSYFSSKDQKKAASKQIKKEKQATKNVKEITGVHGDTIFYTDVTYDSQGSILNHVEGFYINANEAAAMSSQDYDDANDYSSLEYSNRIKRFHNQAVVLDDDDDFSWTAFNAGFAAGATTWSIFRPYSFYWTYDPWLDPWYGWSWRYHSPYYYSWGWHYPYYYHRYYYGFGPYYHPYYHRGYRHWGGPRHGIHHPYSSYSDNSRRAYRRSYNGTRGNPGSAYRSSSTGGSYRSSGSTRSGSSYRSSGSNGNSYRSSGSSGSSYRSSGSTRSGSSYRSSGSNGNSYRSSGSSGSSYRSSGASRSGGGSYRSSGGGGSYRSSGGGASRGGGRR